MNHAVATPIAVFLDRDGTLNEDHGYVTTPEQLVLFSEVPQALARLNHLDVRVILITNQSAIGRGFMTVQVLEDIHHKLQQLLEAGGGRLDAVYFCPHHPNDGCLCRKPGVAMIQQAAKDFSLDVSQCYLVGDKASDLETAYKTGMRGVLVMSSDYSDAALTASHLGQFPIAHIAQSFVQAVDWIERDLSGRPSD